MKKLNKNAVVQTATATTANLTSSGYREVPQVHLLSLVDLLAEAFVARLASDNDTDAPFEE